MSERQNCNICKKTFATMKTISTHLVKFHSHSDSQLPRISNTVSFAQSSQLDSTFNSEISHFSLSHNQEFIISSLNICSLRNKFHLIEFILNDQNVDILVINETRLTKNDDDSNFINPFYHMLRRDRELNGGGGVIVYVKNSLKFNKAAFDVENEIISFICHPNQKMPIAIIACYRPPHVANEEGFFWH